MITQFAPLGMRDPELVVADPPANAPEFRRDLRVTHLGLQDDEGTALLDGVTFSLDLPTHLAVVGPSGAGKEELMLCLAGLSDPTSGRALFDGECVSELPDSVIGRKIAFIGNPTHIFAGCIRDNLLYGLMNRPVREAADGTARSAYLLEAERSGNAPFYPHDDWIGYQAAGLTDESAALSAMIAALEAAHLGEDAYLLGLRGCLTLPGDDALAARILDARREMRSRLAADAKLSRLVEPFDPERYNSNATLAENLLFGTPVGDTFDIEKLAEHDYVRSVLDGQGLTEELITVGYRLAATMVELFADLPPDHEYFRQFSFIDAEQLPDYRALVGRVDANHLDELSKVERAQLLSLPFKLIPARHRLGLVDGALREKLLAARRAFREGLPEKLRASVDFFDPATYNQSATLQDNILFGKIAYGQAQAAEKIAALTTEILQSLELRENVIEIGLRSECGLGGGRLSAAQRQKLGIARALMKRPEVLILSDATGPLDGSEARSVMSNILESFADRTVIWSLQEPDRARRFREVLVMHQGRVIEKGTVEEVDKDGTAFRRLLER